MRGLNLSVPQSGHMQSCALPRSLGSAKTHRTVRGRSFVVTSGAIRPRDVAAKAAKASEAATLIYKDTSDAPRKPGSEPVEEPVNFKVKPL